MAVIKQKLTKSPDKSIIRVASTGLKKRNTPIYFKRSVRFKESKMACYRLSQPQQFQKHYQHYTPAMKRGLTKTALTWRYLLTIPLPTNY